MIDTHAHILSEFYDDIDELIEELKSKNIIKVINCADSIETSKEVLNPHLLVGIKPEVESVFMDEYNKYKWLR